MKITKFVHSCLLVELENEAVLFDPGVFSWESGLFDVNKLDKLEAVVITHKHPDHFHMPFVRALVDRFPDVCFISTAPVVAELQKAGIKAICQSTDTVRVFSTKRHAPLTPPAEPPEHIAVHVAGRLTVGGDRHDLEETKEILAFAITAPWGSSREAAEMVLRMKPKTAIPIHDWHWNDRARQMEYDRFEKLLADHGITFIRPVDGKPFEV